MTLQEYRKLKIEWDDTSGAGQYSIKYKINNPPSYLSTPSYGTAAFAPSVLYENLPVDTNISVSIEIFNSGQPSPYFAATTKSISDVPSDLGKNS